MQHKQHQQNTHTLNPPEIIVADKLGGGLINLGGNAKNAPIPPHIQMQMKLQGLPVPGERQQILGPAKKIRGLSTVDDQAKIAMGEKAAARMSKLAEEQEAMDNPYGRPTYAASFYPGQQMHPNFAAAHAAQKAKEEAKQAEEESLGGRITKGLMSYFGRKTHTTDQAQSPRGGNRNTPRMETGFADMSLIPQNHGMVAPPNGVGPFAPPQRPSQFVPDFDIMRGPLLNGKTIFEIQREAEELERLEEQERKCEEERVQQLAEEEQRRASVKQEEEEQRKKKKALSKQMTMNSARSRSPGVRYRPDMLGPSFIDDRFTLLPWMVDADRLAQDYKVGGCINVEETIMGGIRKDLEHIEQMARMIDL